MPKPRRPLTAPQRGAAVGPGHPSGVDPCAVPVEQGIGSTLRGWDRRDSGQAISTRLRRRCWIARRARARRAGARRPTRPWTGAPTALSRLCRVGPLKIKAPTPCLFGERPAAGCGPGIANALDSEALTLLDCAPPGPTHFSGHALLTPARCIHTRHRAAWRAMGRYGSAARRRRVGSMRPGALYVAVQPQAAACGKGCCRGYLIGSSLRIDIMGSIFQIWLFKSIYERDTL